MLAVTAVAQSSAPAKMIVVQGNAMAITDYPTMVRCEAARVAPQRRVEQENAASRPPQSLPAAALSLRCPSYRERSASQDEPRPPLAS